MNRFPCFRRPQRKAAASPARKLKLRFAVERVDPERKERADILRRHAVAVRFVLDEGFPVHPEGHRRADIEGDSRHGLVWGAMEQGNSIGLAGS